MRVPLYKPDIRPPDITAVLAVLRSGWISHRGPMIQRFEAAFAKAVGARYAVAVSSGTAALHCALVASGVKPGDEVLVPGLTYVAPANAVRHAGAVPYFIDVDKETWCMNAGQASAYNGVAIPVHLYGYPCPSPLKIRLVQDCCEALGSENVGQTTSVWSFFTNKTITTGEGGMVTTQSEEVAKAVWSLSHQGVTAGFDEYAPPTLGWNYRMTAFQAALGLSQLRRLPSVVRKKRQIARWCRTLLADAPVQFQADHAAHAHWLVSARVRERDALRAHLAAAGIETRPVFPAMGDTPVAHKIAAEGISFPSWPGLSRAQVRYMCEAVRRFYR